MHKKKKRQQIKSQAKRIGFFFFFFLNFKIKIFVAFFFLLEYILALDGQKYIFF